MGMYICGPDFQRYNVRDDTIISPVAPCEVCGEMDGDWTAKLGLRFTGSLERFEPLAPQLERVGLRP